MGIHFLIFLAINGFFIWRLILILRRRPKKNRKPFFGVVDKDGREDKADDDWQRKVRAEIDEMTK